MSSITRRRVYVVSHHVKSLSTLLVCTRGIIRAQLGLDIMKMKSYVDVGRSLVPHVSIDSVYIYNSTCSGHAAGW